MTKKKKETFWDLMNSPNWAQDVTTGEFINEKTGEIRRFTLRLKKQ